MQPDSGFDSSEFLDALLERVDGAFNCPICHDGNWTVVDSVVRTEFGSTDVGAMLTVPVICGNCGFVAQFAAGQEQINP